MGIGNALLRNNKINSKTTQRTGIGGGYNNCTTAAVRSSLSMPASLSTLSSTGNNNNSNNQSSNHNAVFARVYEEPTPIGLLPPPNKPHGHTFHRLHRRSKSMSTPNLVTAVAAAAAAAGESQALPPMDDNNLLNNLGMLVPMSTGESVSASTMTRTKSASDLIVLSSAFSNRLMNDQHLLKRGEEGRDPLTKHKQKQLCFELPFGIGGLFRLCLEDSL